MRREEGRKAKDRRWRVGWKGEKGGREAEGRDKGGGKDGEGRGIRG